LTVRILEILFAALLAIAVKVVWSIVTVVP
jgi:hypothetical protein